MKVLSVSQRILLSWIVLSVGPAICLGAEKETQYMAVFMGGKKVGYARNIRQVGTDKVLTESLVKLTIARAGTGLTFTVEQSCTETLDGKPLGFKVSQDLGVAKETTIGTVKDDKIVIRSDDGSKGEQAPVNWPQGALLAEGQRLLARQKGLKEGTSYSTKVFDPSLMTAMDVQTKIGPKRQVDLLGRSARLTEVKQTVLSPKLDMTIFMDDQFEAQKMTTSIAGMQVEMVACDKRFALSKNDVLDFFDKLLVQSPVSLADLTARQPVTYLLEPIKPGASLKILSSDYQSVRGQKDGSIFVTVHPMASRPGEAFPYKGIDKQALEALKPTHDLQCDRKEIIDLARKAVGDAKDSAQAVGRLEAFVGKYITKKDLSVGYATAAEVVQSRQGDCTEHAVLLAAMCRAVGIPARVVVGLAYVPEMMGKKDVLAPHAWAEALVAGKWVGLDAALGRHDGGHLALVSGDGESSGFFDVVDTLGNFRIAKVTVRK